MNLNYIDTHAHVNLAQFQDDVESVLQKCAEEGVAMINVGTHKATSEKAVALASLAPHAYAIVGVHPCNVVTADPDDPEPVVEGEFDYAFYKALAEGERVVGIGECGFDFFHNPPDSYEAQREVFEAQIALANEVGKPLMLHLRNAPAGKAQVVEAQKAAALQSRASRDFLREGSATAPPFADAAPNAYDAALDILRQQAKVSMNAHFYAGTIEQAKQFFDLGGTISFTGVITFARKHYEDIVAYAPLDRIHAETDCPYVAPEPYRGQRAEPWMVKEVVKTIADIKKLPEENVREQLFENAKRFYKL